jgi:predicted metal-dependent hydrolase
MEIIRTASTLTVKIEVAPLVVQAWSMPRGEGEDAFIRKWKAQEDLMRTLQELSPTAPEQLPPVRTEISIDNLEDASGPAQPGEWISILGKLQPVPEGATMESLRELVERTAQEVVLSRARFWAERMGKRVSHFGIKRVKSYWGICYHQTRRISFNYALAMCPVEAIDYVAVHELCHLDHPHHRRSFWAAVERILPDYKKQEAVLRKYSGKIERLC